MPVQLMLYGLILQRALCSRTGALVKAVNFPDLHSVLLWTGTCPHCLQRRYNGQQSSSQHLPQFRSWQAQQQQQPPLPPQAPKQAVSQGQRPASAGTAAKASTQGEPANHAAHLLLMKGVLPQVLVHQLWYLGRVAAHMLHMLLRTTCVGVSALCSQLVKHCVRVTLPIMLHIVVLTDCIGVPAPYSPHGQAHSAGCACPAC